LDLFFLETLSFLFLFVVLVLRKAMQQHVLQYRSAGGLHDKNRE